MPSPKRSRVDEHDEVELETLRELGRQRADPGRRRERGVADDAGDTLRVLGEPPVEDGGSSEAAAWTTGRSVLRIEVGTLASGIAARMTGSASAMTACGVR